MAPIAFHIHMLISVYDITVVSTAPQEDVTKRQWTYELGNKWLKEKKKKKTDQTETLFHIVRFLEDKYYQWD